ncbi:head-closure protein [Vibrio phage 1.262.O._10N.286.51.A9]|nr:head-closure protein [Vibrio phage 1.262.O._10N.286.51.A9]
MQFERYNVDRPNGVNLAQEPSQLPEKVWDNADQVAFRHGTTKKVSGYERGFGETGGTVEGESIPDVLLPLRDDDGEYYWWSYATSYPDDKIYRILSTDNHVDVSPIGGIDDEPDFIWSGDSINGVPYFTKAVPYKYGVSEFEKQVPFPFFVKANRIRTFRNFMIALNFETEQFDPIDWDTDDYYKNFGFWAQGKHQSALWWSSSLVGKDLDELSWADADPTSESGWNFLGGAGGNLVDGVPLRDSFILYRERSVWQMVYTGGINVFAFKEIFNDAGALSGDCAIEVEGKHLVIGQSDIYMHDGVTKTSIADGVIRREIFESIDPNYIDSVFIAPRYKDKEAWICIPEAGSNAFGRCNKAYVYNWEEGAWSIRDIPNALCSAWGILSIPTDDITWTAESEGGDIVVIGNDGEDIYGAEFPDTIGCTWEESSDKWIDASWSYSALDWGMTFGSLLEETEGVYTGAIYTMIDNPLKDGQNFTASVEKKWMDMGDQNLIKSLNRIFPVVRGTGTIKVYTAGSMTTMQAPQWQYAGEYDPSVKTHLGCRSSGKYLHVKFEWDEISRLEVKGYSVEYKVTGAR